MARNLKLFFVFSTVTLVFLLLFGQTAFPSGAGTHGVVGGSLGYSFAKTNFQAFILGFLSHALLDFTPHHDPSPDNPYDLTLYTAFNLGGVWVDKEIYEETDRDSKFLWGSIGGMIPDLEHLFYFDRCVGGECPDKLYPSHNGTIPHHGNASMVQGYLTEAGLIGICVTINF